MLLRNDTPGGWHPNTCPKQDEAREACRTKRFVLLEGARYTSKSVANYHVLAEHAWSTHPGNISIISISQTVGMDSGVWEDIVKHVLPEWIGHHPDGRPWEGKDWRGQTVEGGNFGMEWARPPYVENVTKKPTCEVTNYAGGVTKIQLDSLQNECDVEARFKSRRYSMIYVPELSTFRSMSTFACWAECLRMLGLPDSAHLFLADTNPPDASCWWIHDMWWDLLDCPDEELKDFIEERNWKMDVETAIYWRKSMARLHFTMEDNLFADPNHVRLLKGNYSQNEELYRRYILGECVQTTTDSIFAEVFRPSFHVVGEPETKANKKAELLPEQMYPEDDCFELMTTWDPGTSTNWAALIVEKFLPDVEKHGPSVAKYNGLPCFKVLCEIMCIGEDVDSYAFVQEVLEQMRFYQGIVPRVLRWKHYSDQNVFDYKDIYGKYYSQIIHEFSEGKIALTGVVKGNQSVQTGLDLVRRLFFEERLWINAARCPVLIEAVKGIKRPKTGLGAVARGSPHKHPIDALRYLLMAECRAELRKSMMLNIRKRRFSGKQERGSLVEIPV